MNERENNQKALSASALTLVHRCLDQLHYQIASYPHARITAVAYGRYKLVTTRYHSSRLANPAFDVWVLSPTWLGSILDFDPLLPTPVG